MKDFVPELVARRRKVTLDRVPLDEMTDVDEIVDRVVAVRRDEARIVAAKFSSFI